MSRARVRRAFVASSSRGHRFMEFFCLTPSGIRVGFPSPRLLRRLPQRTRSELRGRVVLALSANRHYALGGIRPGTPLTRARRRLRLSRPFHVGPNTWYLSSGRTRGVLEVRHGVVEEVGIALSRLTRTPGQDGVFLRSFS
jgi:hypothetical protein